MKLLFLLLSISNFHPDFVRTVNHKAFSPKQKVATYKQDSLPETAAVCGKLCVLGCCDEVEPTIEKTKWLFFMTENATPLADSIRKLGIPRGTYTINIRFMVDKDGSLQDIKALNDPGFGLAKGLVKIMQYSPKWRPGKACGRVTRYYKTQPVVFEFLEEEDECDPVQGQPYSL